jgi:hypothetical protein
VVWAAWACKHGHVIALSAWTEGLRPHPAKQKPRKVKALRGFFILCEIFAC